MSKSIITAEVFKSELPDISKATAGPLELTGEYWSPENAGETRRMFFNEIRQETTIDQQGNDIELSVAYFVEVRGGNMVPIRQASRRLVAVLENFKVQPGTPLEITYKGKQRNKTNSFMSDFWSVRPLIIE